MMMLHLSGSSFDVCPLRLIDGCGNILEEILDAVFVVFVVRWDSLASSFRNTHRWGVGFLDTAALKTCK